MKRRFVGEEGKVYGRRERKAGQRRYTLIR